MDRRVQLGLFAACVIAGVGMLLAERLEDTIFVPRDHPAIQYGQGADDPVARLDKRLRSAHTKLTRSPNVLGYLPSLLKELGINADSQMLVFSKTSTQVERINPRTPRAIYFNDETTVGFVQGSDVLELTSLDPKE